MSRPEPTIPLKEWARRKYADPVPCRETLRRWVRGFKIYPQPELVGREYRVDPNARYIDPTKPHGT